MHTLTQACETGGHAPQQLHKAAPSNTPCRAHLHPHPILAANFVHCLSGEVTGIWQLHNCIVQVHNGCSVALLLGLNANRRSRCSAHGGCCNGCNVLVLRLNYRRVDASGNANSHAAYRGPRGKADGRSGNRQRLGCTSVNQRLAHWFNGKTARDVAPKGCDCREQTKRGSYDVQEAPEPHRRVCQASLPS